MSITWKNLLPEGSGSNYQRLYLRIRQAIEQRQIIAGEKLPSTRALAHELGLARNTVKFAYEWLIAEGFLTAYQGRGTFVSEAVLPPFERKQPDRVGGRRCLSQRLQRLPPASSDQRVHSVDEGLQPQADEFPIKQWRRCLASVSQINSALVSANGYLPLCEDIADYLKNTRGIRCEPQQVFLFSGSQQAIVTALLLLADAKSPILVEDPGFIGIYNALRLLQLDSVPVTADQSGFDIERGKQLSPKAKIALVTPSRNYPMGYTLSLKRRGELIAWAQDHQSWIIEDDFDAEFRFDGPPLTALYGLDSYQRTLYAGTFTHIMFQAIRLGFIVVPTDCIDALAQLRLILDGGLSPIVQVAMHRFMRDGHFMRHLHASKKRYKKRRVLLSESISQKIPNLQPIPSDGGVHHAYLLDNLVEESALIAALGQQRAVRALSTHYRSHRKQAGLILSYRELSDPEIIELVEKLARLMQKSA